VIARNLEARIVKLEAIQAWPDEMLVVWRRPDGDVSEALKLRLLKTDSKKKVRPAFRRSDAAASRRI
jgi:hypothetical protein